LLFALAREQYEAVIRLKNPSKTPFPNNDLPRARLKLHGRIFRPRSEHRGDRCNRRAERLPLLEK
jgi:hypothetical protein